MKRKKTLIIILILIIISILGFKIYFEIDNAIYNNLIKQMMKNNELNIQIERSIEHKTLKMNDYEINYFVSGKENNDLIVFLHPAFADHRCFDKQIEYFSQDYRVITIDMLGHGLSKVEKTKDKIDFTINHIDNILNIEGYNKAHLVGVSMGTLIAQYYALHYPDKVQSMTILGGYDINANNKELAKAQRSENIKWIFSYSVISVYKEIPRTLLSVEKFKPFLYGLWFHQRPNRIKQYGQ